MTSNIVQLNLKDLSKEFKTDEDGKGFVTRRGLARMCGVNSQGWGRSGNKFTLEIDRYLAEGGFDVVTFEAGSNIPDLIAAEVIGTESGSFA
jgi:hypothetical protein